MFPKTQTLTACLAALALASTSLAQDHRQLGRRYVFNTACRVSVALPVGDVSGRHLYRNASGRWAALPQAKLEHGTLTFTLSPQQLRAGRTTLLIGKPDWLDVDDSQPPKVTAALVDGKPAALDKVDLGWLDKAPQRLELALADGRNPLDRASIRAVVNSYDVRPDGKALRFEPDAKSDRKGRIVASIPDLLVGRPQGATRLVVECRDLAPDTGKASFELKFVVTRPPQIALDKPAATAADGTRIFVDSIYAGYENVDCILDGKAQTPGTTTVGSSWASAETPQDHWVCFVLPKPRDISGVDISWANWKSTYWTSSRFDILTWDGRQWQRALRVQGNAEAATTSHAFARRRTDRVLLWQPEAGGHANMPNIFWMSEVTFRP